MRVLFVNAHGTDVTVGGTELYVARLVDLTPALGVQPSLLTAFPSAEPNGAAIATLHERDWRRSRARRMQNHVGSVVAQPSRRLERLIAQMEPDVAHTNNLLGLSTAVWEVCRRLGVPVVHTLHDYYLLCPRVTLVQRDGTPCRPHPLLCGLRTRRLARWADTVRHVIGVSQHIVDRHSALFSKATTHVVRHPFQNTSRRRFAPPGERVRRLGYLGALDRHKGVEELLAAAPRLAEGGVRLHVAGDGRLREVVEAADKRGELDYRGHLTGPAKKEFLAGCELGIVPSIWEEPGGPPLTVFDWLSAGRPVLASPRGGLCEALDRLPGCVAVEPTAAGIVTAVRDLLDSRTWRSVAESVRPVETRSLEQWAGEHVAVYHAALSP